MTALTQEQPAKDKDYIKRARETFIRISLIALIGVTCYLVLRPFLLVIVWSVVLATAVYPAYRWIGRRLGGRERLAAVLCATLLLVLVVVPAVLFAETLAGGLHSVALRLQNGNLNMPPPPTSLDKWPVVGPRLNDVWSLASTDLADALSKLTPQIRKYIPVLLSASAAVGVSLLQFILSILLAGYLLATHKNNARLATSIFGRIFGDDGPEFEKLTETTIRSVTNGILGVALIQSILAGIGFLAVGLPGAGLWTALFLVASVLQIGPLILIPAMIYGFASTNTSYGVVFLIWCGIVGLTDNVLKPLLLGRGSKVPSAVIFVGVIGGFVSMGIIGLFVGAIILSVGYKLFLVWLTEDMPTAAEAPRS